MSSPNDAYMKREVQGIHIPDLNRAIENRWATRASLELLSTSPAVHTALEIQSNGDDDAFDLAANVDELLWLLNASRKPSFDDRHIYHYVRLLKGVYVFSNIQKYFSTQQPHQSSHWYSYMHSLGQVRVCIASLKIYY